MTRLRALFLAALLLAAPHAAAAEDIEVLTSVSQTALWVGSVVTYTVTLTCRPGIDVLQEDLGADKLPLDGLQVVSHTVNRDVLSDGRIKYRVAYRLTTFEPGAETVGVGDWTVRYVRGPHPTGASAPAQELRVPGAALAWRSALPSALNTLDIRDGRAADPAQAWWRLARPAGLGLLAVSAVAFAWIVIARVAQGRRPKLVRRIGKESARDFQSALSALGTTNVANPAERRSAYATLDAAVRRRAGDLSGLPGDALTPAEFQARLFSERPPFAAEELTRILSDCEQARYQPAERLPAEQEFRATLDAAQELFTSAR